MGPPTGDVAAEVQTDDLSLFDEDTNTSELVSPRNNFGVLRLFQEFDNRTRIGGILVSRFDVDDPGDRNVT